MTIILTSSSKFIISVGLELIIPHAHQHYVIYHMILVFRPCSGLYLDSRITSALALQVITWMIDLWLAKHLELRMCRTTLSQLHQVEYMMTRNNFSFSVVEMRELVPIIWKTWHTNITNIDGWLCPFKWIWWHSYPIFLTCATNVKAQLNSHHLLIIYSEIRSHKSTSEKDKENKKCIGTFG